MMARTMSSSRRVKPSSPSLLLFLFPFHAVGVVAVLWVLFVVVLFSVIAGITSFPFLALRSRGGLLPTRQSGSSHAALPAADGVHIFTR